MSPQSQPTRTTAIEPYGSFAYEHCDIPPGLTVDQWRRTLPPRRPPRRRLRLALSLPSRAAAAGIEEARR